MTMMTLYGLSAQYALLSIFILVSVVHCNSCPLGQYHSGYSCQSCHCHDGPRACEASNGVCRTGYCEFGWTNLPYCQTPCVEGRFGLQCSGICNCPVGDTCSKVNGLCHSGVCLYGFTGPSCQKKLPELSSAPHVQVDGPTQLTIKWNRWSSTSDIGTGPISVYYLQNNEQGKDDWLTLATIYEDYMKSSHTYTAQCFEPGKSYRFRLVLAMDMGDKSKLSVPSPSSTFFQTSQGSDGTDGVGEIGSSNNDVPPVTSITLSQKTTESIFFLWNCDLTNTTNNYTIGFQVSVLLEDSYTTKATNQETLIYMTDKQSQELYLLFSASKYKVTVISFDKSSGKTGIPAVAQFWTVQADLPQLQHPEILSVSDSTMHVKMYGVDYTNGPISVYKIIVEDITQEDDDSHEKYLRRKLSTNRVDEITFLGYENATSLGLKHYISLEIVPSNVQLDGSVFVIGNSNSSSPLIWNVPLVNKRKYLVWGFVYSELDGSQRVSFAKSQLYAIPGVGLFMDDPHFQRNSRKRAAIIACSIVFGLLFLILLIALMLYWYYIAVYNRNKNASPYDDILTYHNAPNIFERLQSLKAGKGLAFFATSTPLRDQEYKSDFQSVNTIDLECTIPGIDRTNFNESSLSRTPKKSNTILIRKLIKHYKDNSVIISDEFKHLPEGIIDSSLIHVACKSENQALNRSSKILAYDTNRVRLLKSNDIQNDYINASKVKSHTHKLYIVTQSPMDNTFVQFWKMIWEQQVDTVVMLMEHNSRDSDMYPKYWPDVEAGRVLYGNIGVQQITYSTVAHYSVRWFEVSCVVDDEIETFNIAHFEYKTWSNSGVPHHTIAFLAFVYRIRDYHQNTATMLVHCQLGTGRSGMFVAIDSLLHEGNTTGRVDIVKCVTTLREERPGLVRTIHQYKFIHEFLIEAFHHRDTRLEANTFEFTYDNMLSLSNSDRRSIIAQEFDLVTENQQEPGLSKSFKWTDYTAYVSPGKRNMTVTQGIPNSTILQDDSTQLLIAELDSHSAVENFVITLYPNRQEKVLQFWNMVFEKGSRCVVMINDNERHQQPYWPAQGYSTLGEDFSLATLTTKCDPTNTFWVRDIELKHGKSKSAPRITVKHFQFTSWPHRKDAPSVVYMLNFVQQVMSWYSSVPAKNRRPLIVHSANGVSRGTLFCVLWTVLERLQEEALVDIYRTTRYTRSFVNAAVTNLDQYRFLYKAVKEQLSRMRQQGSYTSLNPLKDPRISRCSINQSTDGLSQSSGENLSTSRNSRRVARKPRQRSSSHDNMSRRVDYAATDDGRDAVFQDVKPLSSPKMKNRNDPANTGGSRTRHRSAPSSVRKARQEPAETSLPPSSMKKGSQQVDENLKPTEHRLYPKLSANSDNTNVAGTSGRNSTQDNWKKLETQQRVVDAFTASTMSKPVSSNYTKQQPATHTQSVNTAPHLAQQSSPAKLRRNLFKELKETVAEKPNIEPQDKSPMKYQVVDSRLRGKVLTNEKADNKSVMYPDDDDDSDTASLTV